MKLVTNKLISKNILASEQEPNKMEAPSIICDNSKQTQQIEELRSEVAKIGKLVNLLKDQNELLRQLPSKNSPQNSAAFSEEKKLLNSGKGS